MIIYYLHSNMVRFIITETVFQTAPNAQFTFQYG